MKRRCRRLEGAGYGGRGAGRPGVRSPTMRRPIWPPPALATSWPASSPACWRRACRPSRPRRAAVWLHGEAATAVRAGSDRGRSAGGAAGRLPAAFRRGAVLTRRQLRAARTAATIFLVRANLRRDISRAARRAGVHALPGGHRRVKPCRNCGAGFRPAIALAGVAELVDALDLGSSDASRGGSSPSARTSQGLERHRGACARHSDTSGACGSMVSRCDASASKEKCGPCK